MDENEVSNGVQGYNSTSINISYVGGIDGQGRARDNRTEAQKVALKELLTRLKTKYPNAHIMGHRDIWGKDSRKWKKMCPCFDAEKEYEYLDNIKLGKYEDSGVDEEAPKAQPETYVYEQPRDYTGFLKEITPWR